MLSISTIFDKLLHLQKLRFTTGFEALRVVKDKVVVAPEAELILDVVDTALRAINRRREERLNDAHLPGSLDLRWIDLTQCFNTGHDDKHGRRTIPCSLCRHISLGFL